jgi:radical SAM protein with 4Fe4S-binding SPASM domain
MPNSKETEELTTNQWISVIRELKEYGVSQIELTGGEALLREDFFKIVDCILESRMELKAILSNGSLISAKILDGLIERHVNPVFQISFDGVNGAHNWTRNSPDAENNTIRGIKLLKKEGFFVQISMSIHKNNIVTLRDTIRMLAEIGIDGVYAGYMADAGNWINYKDFKMSGKEYCDAFLGYLPFFIDDNMPLNLQLGVLFSYSKSDNSYFIPIKKSKEERYICPTAAQKIYVSPYGTLFPCPLFVGTEAGLKMPNILHHSLVKALSQPLYAQYSRCVNHVGSCEICNHKGVCRGVCGGGERCFESNFNKEKELYCAFFSWEIRANDSQPDRWHN